MIIIIQFDDIINLSAQWLKKLIEN